MSSDRQLAIVWAAVAKIADREGRRELLVAGTEHDVELTLAGHADGRPIDKLRFSGRLAIGEDQTRAKSVPVAQEVLVAYLLHQIGKGKREALLRDLAAEFDALGGRLPEIPEADVRVEEARGLLDRLRGRTETTVKGSVSCRYSIE